jgi:hypothetical protein
MQIVIGISEKDYNRLKRKDDFDDMFLNYYEKAIVHGTPLPKGHGRLIDADAFITKMEDASKRHKYKELSIDDCLTVDDVFKTVIGSLQNRGIAEGDTPTIIEADKAESEDKE